MKKPIQWQYYQSILDNKVFAWHPGDKPPGNAVLVSGQPVWIKGGRYDGCICTYVQPFYGGHIVKHSDGIAGEIEVPAIESKRHCPGCGCTELLVNGLCYDCRKVVRKQAENMRPDNLRFAESPEL